MSRPVDEKIVKLSMDASDFQAKATKTTSIFGKMKATFERFKGFTLKGPEKSLSAMSNNMGALESDVGKVSSSFNAMSVIAAGALLKIGAVALDVGARLAHALTIKPLVDGLQEYEIKINAIQTMMSNDKSLTMGQITSSLDDLNTYADKTIYNFADMTRSIGTFMTAGVKLDDSQAAIKGIANLAAASGASSAQASNVMYQLSQALASGDVRLRDWMSVENSMMGGKLFQEALTNTAKNMGVARDETVKFRDSLADGWLTADILLATLEEFSEDQSMIDAATKVKTFTQLLDTTAEAIGSGWAKTWELLVGDFESAREMWTSASQGLNAIIDGSADARNKLIQDFVDLGGRQSLINGVSNSFKALMHAVTTVKKAFHDVFPKVTAERLASMAKGLENFTKKLILGKKGTENLRATFRALFSVMKTVIDVLVLIGKTLINLIPDDFGMTVANLVKHISNFVTALVGGVSSGNRFTKVIQNIGEIAKSLVLIFWNLIKTVGSFLSKLTKGALNVSKTLSPVTSEISAFLKELSKDVSLEDILTLGFIGAVVKGIKSISDRFGNLTDAVGGFFDGFSDMFGSVTDTAKNIGLLTDALATMTVAVKAHILLAIASSVTMLAIAMKLISGIKAQDIFKSLQVLGVMLIGITQSLSFIGKLNFGGGAIKGATLLMTISASVIALSVGLKILSTINTQEMIVGLVGLVTILTSLVTAMTFLSNIDGKMKTSSLKMIGLATAIVILSGAITILSKIKVGDLIKSVTALGVIFLELGFFLKLVDKTKLRPSTAVGMTVISAAILIMVGAINQIANIPVGSLLKGLGALTLILAEITIFTQFTSGARVMSASVGMIALAAAINLLVYPIEQFSNMSLTQLAKGLGALGIVLAEIVVAMKLAATSGGGAVAILAMAAAIAVLVPPLVSLSNLSLKQLGIAFLALAGAFGVMGAAAYLLTPVSPVLGLLAISITAIGVAIGASGIVLLGFAATLTTLASLTVASIATIGASLSMLLSSVTQLIPKIVKLIITLVVSMAEGLAEGGPALFKAGAQLLLGLLTTIRDYIPQILLVGLQIVTALMDALAQGAPGLMKSAANLIVTLIDTLANTVRDNNEKIVRAVLNLLESILEVVVTALVELVDVIFGWIPGVSKVTEKLGTAAKETLRDAFDIEPVGEERGSEFIDGVKSNQKGSESAGKSLGAYGKKGAESVSILKSGEIFGKGFDSGLASNKSNVNTTGIQLAKGGRQGAESVKLTTSGKSAGKQYADGVNTNRNNARGKGKNIGNSAKSGASTVSLRTTGSNAGQGFANGLGSKERTVSSAASRLANAARGTLKKILSIFSPSRALREDGNYAGEGFALGIEDQVGNVEGKAKIMAENAMSAVKSYAQLFSDAMNNEMDLNPVIAPVLDLTNVDKIDLDTRADDLKASLYNARRIQAKNIPQSINNVEYKIYVTANGDLPFSTIKKMAKTIQKEIKNQNDSIKLSRGEEVVF